MIYYVHNTRYNIIRYRYFRRLIPLFSVVGDCMKKRIMGIVMLGMHVLCAQNVYAQTTNSTELKGFQVKEVRVGTGVSAERWSEDALYTIYGKGGKLLPTLYMGYRFHKRISLDASLGTGRLTANSDRNVFQMLPVSVGGSLLFGNDSFEPFVSVGAGFVQYSEKLVPYYNSEYPSITYGTKLGVTTKAGVRIGTRLVQTSQFPDPKGPSQLDIELSMGYRVHQAFGIGNGLNMNAFTTNVGLVLRF